MRLITLVAFLLLGPRLGFAASTREAEPIYKIPSSITVSGTSSNADTKSIGAGVRLFLPQNYWVDATFDRATEQTDELETKTIGGSFSVGTDPLDQYSLDLGFDAFGIEDQFQVQEARVRVAAMPTSFESILEIRSARFSFANSPNAVFQNREVILDAHTLRLEFGWYGWTPWSVRAWTELVQVASGFSDLARPLAPIFIPVTAISTALSWPGEEYGFSTSYSRRLWGARITVSTKRAIISGDRTATLAVSGDYKWTRHLTSGVRISRVSTLEATSGSTDLDPILTTGLDLTYSF